jgi:hypothetical protein
MDPSRKFMNGVKNIGSEMASVIRLGEAYFCLNCEVATNCPNLCPSCGHSQLWLLQNWIGKINAPENASDNEGTPKDVRLARPFGLERILERKKTDLVIQGKVEADYKREKEEGYRKCFLQ